MVIVIRTGWGHKYKLPGMSDHFKRNIYLIIYNFPSLIRSMVLLAITIFFICQQFWNRLIGLGNLGFGKLGIGNLGCYRSVIVIRTGWGHKYNQKTNNMNIFSCYCGKKFKQWWPVIPEILIKRPTIPHLKSYVALHFIIITSYSKLNIYVFRIVWKLTIFTVWW